MTNSNENLEPKKNSKQIGINEDGELVVNDPQLEQALDELTPEELEEIDGGTITVNVYRCGSKQASFQ